MATTKITKGKSFRAAIDYVSKNGKNKEDQKIISELAATKDEVIAPGFEQGRRARLLGTNLIDGDLSKLVAQFEEVAAQRPGIKQPVHKVSINLKPGERLETHQMIEVGNSYLKEMGFENCPYAFVQHREKDHQHGHLVVSTVDFNGDVVSDQFQKKRARTWANRIEEEYGLFRTPEKSPEKGLSRNEIYQSKKTGKPPPRMILQANIKQTLETYPETPDFINALHDQNISIRVRCNEDKEIIGVSYGLNGKGFTAGSLGENFKWKGLLANGLKYDHQRDYERLEEASRRSSQGKLESAGRKPGDAATAEQNGAESNGFDYAYVGGNSELDRFGSQQSGRGEDGGIRVSAGRKQSSHESVLSSATKEKPNIGEKHGEFKRSDEAGFRQLRQFDSEEIETAGRIEPKNYPETITAEADTAVAAEADTKKAGRNSEDSAKREEYYAAETLEQQSELFDQSFGGNLRAEPIGNQLPTGPNDAPGAGHTDLDGVGGNTVINSGNNGLADKSGFSRDLVCDPAILPAVDNSTAGSTYASDDNSNDRGWYFGDLGIADSGGRDTQHDQDATLGDLSSGLRQSLDTAEETAEKTISITEAQEAEAEAKKIEQEEIRAIRLEMIMSRGRSI